ncbi:MAG: hypothetical protein NXI23_19715 [Bacteroidetes bacterium]|jgi:hypothetical protein|nr:hypothetical protein [Bacteroidota bacterium]MDF1867825.1 hypothetical protein [Saprospiraceae bacterium]
MKKSISVWFPISLSAFCLFLFAGTVTAQSGTTTSSNANTRTTTTTANTANKQATMDLLTLRYVRDMADVGIQAIEDENSRVAEEDEPTGIDGASGKNTQTRTRGTNDANDNPSDDDNDRSFGFGDNDSSSSSPSSTASNSVAKAALNSIRNVVDVDGASRNDNPPRTREDDEDVRTRDTGDDDPRDPDAVDYRKRRSSKADTDDTFGFGDTGGRGASKSTVSMTLKRVDAMLENINPTRGADVDGAPKSDDPARTRPSGDDDDVIRFGDDAIQIDAITDTKRALTTQEKVAIIQHILHRPDAAVNKKKSN